MPQNFKKDLTAAAAVTMLGVPQGIAYAMIAGLPPSAGLYASTIPTIVASMARSSHHVVAGPTNALSLLVGTALISGNLGTDPVGTAMTLALMVGIFQVLAGLLRLGAIVNYISRAVILGYISGAGLLIGLGQLGNITGSPIGKGDPMTRLQTWFGNLSQTDWRTLLVAMSTLLGLLLLRRYVPKAPGAIVALAVGIGLSWFFDFKGLGLATAGDLSPVPAGLPPLYVPALDVGTLKMLLPVAIAATVLSLVESSSLARAIAVESGQRLDMNREFVGQGLGNIGAGFTGGYPVSGSLSRSAMNHRAGAVSRWAGVMAGFLMLLVLLIFGPLVDLTPIASLAGLLLLVAFDLVDRPAIMKVMRSVWGDKLAFLGTFIGTWTLSLDTAIYLGVGISIVLFLHRARYLRVKEMVVQRGQLQELVDGKSEGRCAQIHILHVEGNLFFGAANELQEALDEASRDPQVKVIVLRLKRARNLDYTTEGVLLGTQERLVAQGRHLLLAGMDEDTMELFVQLGLAEAFGSENIFPSQGGWFRAMHRAVQRALALVGSEHNHEDCALEAYLRKAHEREAGEIVSTVS